MSGRKRPRTGDVDSDVVATLDADPAAVIAAVSSTNSPATWPTPQTSDTNLDVCHACYSVTPPACKNRVR